MNNYNEKPKGSFADEVIKRVAQLNYSKQTIVKPLQTNNSFFKGLLTLGFLIITILLIVFISGNYDKESFVTSLALLTLISSAYISILFFKWIK